MEQGMDKELTRTKNDLPRSPNLELRPPFILQPADHIHRPQVVGTWRPWRRTTNGTTSTTKSTEKGCICTDVQMYVQSRRPSVVLALVGWQKDGIWRWVGGETIGRSASRGLIIKRLGLMKNARMSSPRWNSKTDNWLTYRCSSTNSFICEYH
jgi:hypothetical protein